MTNTPASPAPTTTPVPPQIAAVSVLGGVGAIGILGGLVLIAVTFGIGNSADLTVSDLAARIATASFAGVALTAGFIASIAMGVLIGIRELLSRYRDGKPF